MDSAATIRALILTCLHSPSALAIEMLLTML